MIRLKYVMNLLFVITLETRCTGVFGVHMMPQRCNMRQLKQRCRVMSDNRKYLYYRPYFWRQNYAFTYVSLEMHVFLANVS